MYRFVLLLILVFAFSAQVDAADPQKALSDFERIAAKIKSGLPNKMMLSGAEYLGYSVTLFATVEVSYDVQETRSLVSPYTGTISIEGSVRSNRIDFPGKRTKSAALAAVEPFGFGKPAPMGGFIVNYAYQNGQWVLVQKPLRDDGWEYYLKTLPENQNLLDLFRP